MDEYPADVREAIEWLHEADCEHVAACLEYDRAFGEAYIKQAKEKREERLSALSFGGQVEHTIATLEVMDARKQRDFWLLQCTRRGNWLCYLMSKETGIRHHFGELPRRLKP